MLGSFDDFGGVALLERAVRDAHQPTAHLLSGIAAKFPRFRQLEQVGKTVRFEQLLACGAWTDAALELAMLTGPGWSLQRLCRVDADWVCTLTQHPGTPDWLDDAAEASHPTPALAIVGALLGAKAKEARMPEVATAHLPSPDNAADSDDYC
jgi:hypothetical protein